MAAEEVLCGFGNSEDVVSEEFGATEVVVDGEAKDDGVPEVYRAQDARVLGNSAISEGPMGMCVSVGA